MVDTLKVTGAGMVGFIAQLTSLDLFFKVSIGFLTCVYLTVKIVQIIKDLRKKE